MNSPVVPSATHEEAKLRHGRSADARRRRRLQDARIERDKLLRRAADARNASVNALLRRGETEKAAEIDSEYAVVVSGVWQRWNELRLAIRSEATA